MVEVPGSSPVVPTISVGIFGPVYDVTMPQTGHRIPKSEATRLKLLACAVEEINSVGPDRLGFTSIARRAGLSTGALYARYENVDELILEVWMAEGLPALRRLLADLEESLSQESGVAARLRISEQLSGSDRGLLILVNLLVASRRSEATYEEIAPSVTEAVEKFTVRTPALEFYLGTMLGIAMGLAGTGLQGLDWQGPIGMIASAVRRSEVPQEIPPHSVAAPETVYFPSDAEEIDMRLFDAVAHVVARVGASQATVSRIARRAKVNPASIYMRYEDKDALFAACMTHVMRMGDSRNAKVLDRYKKNVESPSEITPETESIMMFRGNQSPEHSSIRRLRLETMFAAMHEENLRRMNHEIYMETITRNEEYLGVPPSTLTNRLVLPFSIFSRFSFFGYAVLAEYGLCDMNHRYLLSYVSQISRTFQKIAQNSDLDQPNKK
jgi:AcrR family transcriptional regulator